MLRSCKLQPLQTLSAALAPASPGGDLLEEENLDVKKKRGGMGIEQSKDLGLVRSCKRCGLHNCGKRRAGPSGFCEVPPAGPI